MPRKGKHQTAYGDLDDYDDGFDDDYYYDDDNHGEDEEEQSSFASNANPTGQFSIFLFANSTHYSFANCGHFFWKM